MIAKAKSKFIKSLQVKKYRVEEQCFVVEGAKSISELLASDFEILTIIGTSSYLLENRKQIRSQIEIIEVNTEDLSGLGSFQTNQDAMAVARMKLNQPGEVPPIGYGLVLDNIRDPGNLGTIIRIADWYGIQNIVASDQSADFYNPKVISASMGSFCRVNIFYTSLSIYLKQNKVTLYGTFLDGHNVHHVNFEKTGLIVIGNEAHGISSEVEQFIDHRISIPRVGKAESLNAAVATAIVLDNVIRLQK
ncbi:MAG: RNA methyltransferase [Bacteroidia bacterium]|nr:RNA methyltransferase [Bacteroidia bacterium]